MPLNTENWLLDLGEDIVARKSLYPGSPVIDHLNSINWLLLLRNDILERGTLYPNGGNVGELTSNNFLLKLRDDIVARGTLYPDFSEPAPDPELTSLVVSGLTLTPAFSPSVYEYTGGSTMTNTTSMTIGVSSDFTTICYFNNVRYTPPTSVALIEGLNTFRVEVTNADSKSVTYVATVVFTPPSTFLASAAFSDVILTPSFEPGVLNYSGTTTAASTTATFNAENPTGTCSATLNGQPLSLSGVGPFTATITLEDTNNIELTVNNAAAVATTYEFAITKQSE